MVEYSYVPNVPNKKPRNNADNSENNKDYIGEFFKSNSKNIKIITGILIAFIILYITGSSITGNMFLSDTDKQLASSENFPQLSKFEANKQYFLCEGTLKVTQQQKITTDTQLETTKMGLNACMVKNTQTMNELNATKLQANTCTKNLNICAANKTQIQNDLDLAEVERDAFKEDLEELQNDFDKLAENYAKKKCCYKENDEWEYTAYRIYSGGTSVKCLVDDSSYNDALDLKCD